MNKCFNIAGPCFPDEHYMLPPLERLPGIMRIVEQRGYFVLHAARQSGKTTALMALVEEINGQGRMNALYFTVETVQRFTDPREGIPKIVESMRNALLRHPLFKDLVRDPASPIPALLPPPPGLDVKALLALLAEKSEKPLVVFFDEVDCLSDDTLITFLRQLRDGYVTRKASPFPASVALVGMRDIRDYKARIRPDGQTLGSASPFNIIKRDLTFSNFGKDDVARLYAQHTEATGQVFCDGVVDKVYEYTLGQPWLVNAIAEECIENIHDYRYDEPITVEDVATAKETIIRARGTHCVEILGRKNIPPRHVSGWQNAPYRGAVTVGRSPRDRHAGFLYSSDRAEVGNANQSACAHHAEDVAGIGGRLVHNAVWLDHQLAKPYEIREVFFKGAFGYTPTAKREVCQIVNGVVDLEKPLCRRGDVTFGGDGVVDFVELAERGWRPDDVHIPCLSRNCRMAVSWSMPRPSAISLRDLRTVSARRNTSISGSKSAALTRTASARPLRVTMSGRCVSFTRAKQAARLLRYSEKGMMSSVRRGRRRVAVRVCIDDLLLGLTVDIVQKNVQQVKVAQNRLAPQGGF